MSIKQTAAIFACKAAKLALRVLGRGGTTLPGMIALRICPEILSHAASGVRTVIITGTNGKTTTARIVEEMCVQTGIPHISNRSGANLITGITTEFISNFSLSGKPKKHFAIIECDEAASKEVCRQVQPEIILLTNLFRDQLDRYGEITQTLENVLVGIKNAPNATVCLNADCSLCVSISQSVPNKIVYFGIDSSIYVNQPEEASDAPFCINCKHEYDYSYHTFAHLGGFSCPSCGYSRPEAEVAVTEILDLALDTSTVRTRVMGLEDEHIINLPGGYNIYNAIAALAVAAVASIPAESAKRAVAGFNCGFGRMERFNMGNAAARMILVKNPAGANQVLNFLSALEDETLLALCLTDKTADGTDVSWIWDVQFERIADFGEKITKVLIAGNRNADMAIRLKYAGVSVDSIELIDNYDDLISAMSKQANPVIIMPTYTAMMDLREKMSAAFGGGNFWD